MGPQRVQTILLDTLLQTASRTLQTPAVHFTRFEFLLYSLISTLTVSSVAGEYDAAYKFKCP